jgi:hypothetical protein
MVQFIPRLEALDGRVMPSAVVARVGAGTGHGVAELRSDGQHPPTASPFPGSPGGAVKIVWQSSAHPAQVIPCRGAKGEEIPQ